MVQVDTTRENLSVRSLRVMIKDVLDEHKIKGQPLIGQKVPASYMVQQNKLFDMVFQPKT